MSRTRWFPGFRISSIGLIAALLMVSITALGACGGGDGDEDGASERDKAIANSPALQTIEASGGTSGPASTVAASPTPVREISMDEAQKQLWVFLSPPISNDLKKISILLKI